MKYRNLTPEEVTRLEQQGNRAENWNDVQVGDVFDPACVYGTCFAGKIYLGDLSKGSLQDGDLILPEGIYASMLRDCCIGNHCAIHNVKMLAGYTIGNQCLLFNIDEMTANSNGDYAWLKPMIENGGRGILPFSGMNIGDANKWARFRGK